MPGQWLGLVFLCFFRCFDNMEGILPMKKPLINRGFLSEKVEEENWWGLGTVIPSSIFNWKTAVKTQAASLHSLNVNPIIGSEESASALSFSSSSSSSASSLSPKVCFSLRSRFLPAQKDGIQSPCQPSATWSHYNIHHVVTRTLLTQIY